MQLAPAMTIFCKSLLILASIKMRVDRADPQSGRIIVTSEAAVIKGRGCGLQKPFN